jgi:hypothetical protein
VAQVAVVVETIAAQVQQVEQEAQMRFIQLSLELLVLLDQQLKQEDWVVMELHLEAVVQQDSKQLLNKMD